MGIMNNDESEVKLNRLRDACSRENDAICQTLGTALGYPRYCDDQANFPGATPTDGVCVGEHVAATLAQEAAERIRKLTAERDKAKAEADRMDAALREIEERLRTRTRPILDMLQQHQTDEAINSWKHAVYGSCIHAQLMMRTKAAGLNESNAG